MAFNDGFSDNAALRALQGETYYTINGVSGQLAVKNGAGFLHGVLFTANNISAVNIYDNTVSGGNVLTAFPVSAMASGPWYQLDVNFGLGMVVSSGSTNTIATISYL